MAKHVYAYYGSKLHLRMEKRLADGFNNVLKAFYDAQEEFLRIRGHRATQQEFADGTFTMWANPDDMEAYRKVCRAIDQILKDEIVVLKEEDMTDDFLTFVR